MRVQKDIRALLLIKRSVMLFVAGNALGLFTGPNVIPFSIDLSDFGRNFRIESSSTIKINIADDVLLINEVHNVLEGNNLSEILTRIWYKILFRTQNRMNCKLCRIKRWDMVFVVVAHHFLQREKSFTFDKVEHWIRIFSRHWWETSPVVGYGGSWKKRVAVVGNFFLKNYYS